MFPNDTALANFVRNYGDALLAFMTNHFYQSGFGKLIVTVAGIVGISLLGYGISQKRWSKYFGMYIFGWLILLPVNDRPFGYVVYNVISSRMSLEVQKIIDGFMKSYKKMPPDFVKNAIFKASSTRITDPKLRNDVHFLIENCIPRASDSNGELYSAADIFSGNMSTDSSGVKVFQPKLDPEVLGNLENRQFKVANGFTNCKSLLLDTNLSLRNHVESKGILEGIKSMVVGPSNGEFESQRVTTYDPGQDQEQKIGKFALNLAQASAIQATILKDYYDTDLDYTGKDYQTINPLIEQFKSSHGSIFNPTRITTEVMNVPRMIGRAFNIFDFYENANRLYEINDKLMKLPYYISYLQIMLKFLVPIVFLSVFIGNFRYLIMWATTWLLTLCVPWLLVLARLVGNSLMLHQLKIEEMVNQFTKDPNLMNIGIDFQASSNMLKDSSVLMDSILQFEDGLWKALFLIIPLAGFFGGNVAGNLMVKGAKVVGGAISRKVAYGAVTKAVKAFGPKGAIVAGAVGAVTSSAASKEEKIADSNFFDRPKGNLS